MPKQLAVFVGVAVVLVFACFRQTRLAQQFDYPCGACGATFELPALAVVMVPHTMQKKRVRCPRCGAVTWATPVPKG